MTLRGIRLALLTFRQSRSKRFEQLVQPHLKPMFTFAFRLTGRSHDAEDLVQDVVAKLFTRLDELEQVRDLRPWLNRVLYRQFVDSIRRRPAGRELTASSLDDPEHQTPFLETLPGNSADPLDALERHSHNAALRRLINELPLDQKTILLLHDADGWRLEDIADILDIPLGTVKSRLHRTRALLRTKLQEELELFEPPLRELERGE